MFGGKIASIGDPIFFPTNFFNVKLNGRFISNDIKFSEKYDINSNYEIVKDGIEPKIHMNDDYEIMYTNEMISFGPNIFPYYILYVNKQFDIINNIVEYILVKTYSYKLPELNPESKSSVIEDNSNDDFNFIKKFIFQSGPYKFDQKTKKFLFLSSNPNILNKYSFANKFKELMDLLYTEIEDLELENKILQIFSQNPVEARIAYENLSDLYNVFSERILSEEKLSEEKLSEEKFNDTFINILGINNKEEKLKRYISDDIKQIKLYKKFIKICDMNPLFFSMYRINLSILFFSVYIQKRLEKPYIVRGNIANNFYPINKTNLILNLFGNIEYNKEKEEEFNKIIHKRKKGKSINLLSILSSKELLVYGQGLRLYDYDRTTFKGFSFANCVENALIQMLKSFCWTDEGYNLNVIEGAKPIFIEFMNKIKTIPNYDNSQTMKDEFAELITVSKDDPMNVKYNSVADNYCYNIKSSYENFLFFLKYILNIEDVYEIIKNKNPFIIDIIIEYTNDSVKTYIIEIKYKDKTSSTFQIYNGHSVVKVKNLLKFQDFGDNEQYLFCSFADSSEILSWNITSSDKNFIFDRNINLIKKEYLYSNLYFRLNLDVISNTLIYFIKVGEIYKFEDFSNKVFFKFVDSIIQFFFILYDNNGSFFDREINYLIDEDKFVKIKYVLDLKYDSNLYNKISEIFVLYNVIYFFYKLKGLNTSPYYYLDKFYKTIQNTLTVEDIIQNYKEGKWVSVDTIDLYSINKSQINTFFNMFVFFYLYLNSSIFKKLYSERYKIIINEDISLYDNNELRINRLAIDNIFKLLSKYMNPDINYIFSDPIIDFSVLTYFLKLLFFVKYNTKLSEIIKSTTNYSNYIKSLTIYYLIKVFDSIIKKEYDNAIFLYDLVINLAAYNFIYDPNSYFYIELQNFIIKHKDICIDFLAHEFDNNSVTIDQHSDYSFKFDYKITDQSNLSIFESNLRSYKRDKSDKSSINYNHLRYDITIFLPILESNVTILFNSFDKFVNPGNYGSKYQKYAKKYLELKDSMQGGRYQFLGINLEPFKSKFPIFIGKRNIIINTDPNTDPTKNYILNNKFELVKLIDLVELLKTNPDDYFIPNKFLLPIDLSDPYKLKKNRSIKDWLKIFKNSPEKERFFMNISFSNFDKIIKAKKIDQEVNQEHIPIYKRMEKFISTNKFREFINLVIDPVRFFIDEPEEMKKNKIYLAINKDLLIKEYNDKIKLINGSLISYQKIAPNISFELYLIPEIIISEETPYIENNQLIELKESYSIGTVIKFIQKFNASNFITIPQYIIKTHVKKNSEKQSMPLNTSNELVLNIKNENDRKPLQINILEGSNDLNNFISQIINYEEIEYLQIVIERLVNIFPNRDYYQNLSDTFEYYFNPEIDGNLYIYKNIKELNNYIFNDLELIHKLKSNPEIYNQDFFINFIALVSEKYNLKIPINEASLYENLFGIEHIEGNI